MSTAQRPGGALLACCELLPVACVGGRAISLRPPGHGGAEGTAWQVPCSGAGDPSQVVIGALRPLLGDPLPPGLIVHSTSWRYDPAQQALVLTYLVVLPSAVAERWLAEGAAATAIGEHQPARGDRLRPPRAVSPKQVLAHALDHLALLAVTDPAVAAALEDGWHRLLAGRQPRPAGVLEPAGR